MKNIITFLFLLLSVAVNAQEIISQTQEIVSQGDSLYFVRQTTIRENGTSFPDTLVNKYLIGDSTTTANTLFDIPYQQYIAVANGMKQALRRNFATSVFNQVNTLFQTLTGKTLYQDAGNRYFGSLQGRYRVFRQDGTNFFANITQLTTGPASGALRLTGENSEGTFVLNALGPDGFLLVNFDHDQVGGGENFYFFWDGESSERKTFWPAERISGRTTIFRIVKIQ